MSITSNLRSNINGSPGGTSLKSVKLSSLDWLDLALTLKLTGKLTRSLVVLSLDGLLMIFEAYSGLTKAHLIEDPSIAMLFMKLFCTIAKVEAKPDLVVM